MFLSWILLYITVISSCIGLVLIKSGFFEEIGFDSCVFEEGEKKDERERERQREREREREGESTGA